MSSVSLPGGFNYTFCTQDHGFHRFLLVFNAPSA